MKRFTKAIIISVISVPLIGVGGLTVWSLNKSSETTIQPQSTVVVAPQPPTVSELLKLVNEERSKVGVAPLQESPSLDWSAQQKANDMVTYNYFGHTSTKSPNDNGSSRQWLLQSGIQCADTSENLHEGSNYYATSIGAVSGWMGSTPHRQAMLDDKYTLTGFGFAEMPDGQETFVEHFCQQ